MKNLMMGLALMLAACSSAALAGTTLSPPDLGVEFRLSAPEVFPGDTVSIYVDVKNPTEETYYGIPLFVVWTIEEDWDCCLYFWPFVPDEPWLAGDVHYYTIDVPPGVTEVEVVPPFLLKGIGYLPATMYLFTGMSNPFFTNVFGSVDWQSMVWHF